MTRHSRISHRILLVEDKVAFWYITLLFLSNSSIFRALNEVIMTE